MSSTRFPGKTLKEIKGKPLLHYVISRASSARKIDAIVVATSDHPDDDSIADFCRKIGVDCFRGSLDDVLRRLYEASLCYPGYEVIVRVTADCPLIDPAVIDTVISAFEKTNADYASNVLTETYPDGVDVEVFTRGALKESHEKAKLISEREHVTLYIRNNPEFKKINVANNDDLSRFRLTVDNPEDLEVISFLVERYGAEKSFKEYCALLSAHPNIMVKNERIERNLGLKKSLKEDGVI